MMRFPRKWNAVIALGILQTVSRFASFAQNIMKKRAYSVVRSCQSYVFSPIYEPLCTITNPDLLQAKSRLNIMLFVVGVTCRHILTFGVVEFCAGW